MAKMNVTMDFQHSTMMTREADGQEFRIGDRVIDENGHGGQIVDMYVATASFSIQVARVKLDCTGKSVGRLLMTLRHDGSVLVFTQVPTDAKEVRSRCGAERQVRHEEEDGRTVIACSP